MSRSRNPSNLLAVSQLSHSQYSSSFALYSSQNDLSSSSSPPSSSPQGGRKSAAVAPSDGGAKANKLSSEPFNLSPVKGTRDFYPDDMRLKNWLFSKWRSVSQRFGFEEYDAPLLESEELYVRKAGEEVTQQLFNFEDKGGRRMALRPEMTPSLARMVLAKKNALPFPLKWEHYQWNMDIWGVAGVEAEAELLSAIVASMQDMGLTAQDVGIKVNSRKILNGLMTKVGIPEDKWVETCILVDKLEKVPVDALSEDMANLGLEKAAVEELLAFLQLKDIGQFASILGDDADGFDSSVVRGLAYYTGVVFEGFDRTGQLRAICGGGRYDKLLQSMAGGEPVPAVGFGFGDAVIVEMLKERGLLPQLPRTDVQAAQIASQLRQGQVAVDLVLDDRKPKWVFQRADRIGAAAVVLVAEEEVLVKNLRSGQQRAVTFSACEEAVREAIDGTGTGSGSGSEEQIAGSG
eukprot:gene25826-34415_t